MRNYVNELIQSDESPTDDGDGPDADDEADEKGTVGSRDTDSAFAPTPRGNAAGAGKLGMPMPQASFKIVMKTFMDEELAQGEKALKKKLKDFFGGYVQLGLFFNDLTSIWPPPDGTATCKTKDIFEIFEPFAGKVRNAQQELLKDAAPEGGTRARHSTASAASASSVSATASSISASGVVPSSTKSLSGQQVPDAPPTARRRRFSRFNPNASIPATASNVSTSSNTITNGTDSRRDSITSRASSSPTSPRNGTIPASNRSLNKALAEAD